MTEPMTPQQDADLLTRAINTAADAVMANVVDPLRAEVFRLQKRVAELETAAPPTLYLALYEGAKPELFTTEQAARDCCDDLAKAEANGRCWDWMRPDENGVVEQWWVHEDNDAPTYATGGTVTPVTPQDA